MTLNQWTSRLRWRGSPSHPPTNAKNSDKNKSTNKNRNRKRLCLDRLFLLFLMLDIPFINSVSSTSLHKHQYDANTLNLLQHRAEYMFQESKRDKEDEDFGGSKKRLAQQQQGQGQGKGQEQEVLRRETAGVNMLRSSKDALIVTKKRYLRKDWCKTEPLIQRIKEPGCVTRTIVNRYCYGQCNSFYIPKDSTTKLDAEDNAFKSCSFCKPKRFRWITITLNCPNLNPPYKRKKIQRIKKCKCISEILQS